MSIFFSPSGILDISTDPSDLPEEIEGRDISSGSMVRCKNLRLDQSGKAKTRDGSIKINETAISEKSVHKIIEQAGDRYIFAGGEIYKNETSIESGLTDSQWGTLLYNQYNSTVQSIYALNGTDRKRIEDEDVYEWGIDAPTAEHVAIGGVGSLSGAYSTRYTYARKEGTTLVSESNPSSSVSVTLSDGCLILMGIEAPSDTQVTHAIIYRSLSNLTVHYLDQDIDLTVSYDYSYAHLWEEEGGYISGTGFCFTTSDATHDTENIFSWEELYIESTVDDDDSFPRSDFWAYISYGADTSLGTQLETDHNRPPLGTFVAGPNYDGTCFILKDNLLYFCKAKRPEYWPTAYYVEVCPVQFTCQCLVFHNGQPYVLTKHKIYYIQGTGSNTFFPLPMESITGAQGPQAAVSVHGHGIYHVGTDGIYLYSERDINVTQSRFRPIFRGETVNDMPGAYNLDRSWLIQYQNRLYFGYPGEDDEHPTNVLVFGLDDKKISFYKYGKAFMAVAEDKRNERLIAADDEGFVWHIENDSATDDNGTGISWEVQSKDYTLQTRAHFPRLARYDVDIPTNSTATGEILLDGSSHQSHVLTGQRDTARRLVDVGNGSRAAFKISGTGPITIYATEME